VTVAEAGFAGIFMPDLRVIRGKIEGVVDTRQAVGKKL